MVNSFQAMGFRTMYKAGSAAGAPYRNGPEWTLWRLPYTLDELRSLVAQGTVLWNYGRGNVNGSATPLRGMFSQMFSETWITGRQNFEYKVHRMSPVPDDEYGGWVYVDAGGSPDIDDTVFSSSNLTNIPPGVEMVWQDNFGRSGIPGLSRPRFLNSAYLFGYTPNESNPPAVGDHRLWNLTGGMNTITSDKQYVSLSVRIDKYATTISIRSTADWTNVDLDALSYSEEDYQFEAGGTESKVMARFNPRLKTSSVGVYLLTASDVNDVVNDLWDTTILEGLRNQFVGDGADTILGLSWLYGLRDNMNESARTARPTFGNIVAGNSPAVPIALNEFTFWDAGSVSVRPYYGDYRDFDPEFSRYVITLPFIGDIELDPSDVVGREVYVRYMINVTSGAASCTVSTDGRETGPGVLRTEPCQWGYDIPLRTTGGLALHAQLLKSLAPAGINFDAGASMSVGSTSPSSADSNILMDFQPRIVVYRAERVDADSMGMIGRPGGAIPVTVGETSGYLKARAVLNTGTLAMRQGEEIVRMLQEGIYVR